MLVFSDVRKAYRNLEVLRGLTLSVPRGSLFGLMGQNGAGKTTLLRIAAGLLAPDSGELLVGGIDVRQRPEEAKRFIGFVPDGFGAYDNMSVLEYMSFFASCFGLYGRAARLRNEGLLKRVGLFDRRDSLVTELSKGMQQRLSLARALIHEPELLVLDEPTNGLDPGSRFSLRELLGELSDSGKTILLSSHVLSELSEICTDIAVLDKGRVRATGEVQEILRQIANSNPLRVTVLNGEKTALRLFRKHPCIRAVMQDGRQFQLEFVGGAEDEASLLQQLIDSEVPVKSFVRESGTLESFFLNMTVGREERIIVQDEDESDL